MSHKLLVDQNLIKYLINLIVILVLGVCVSLVLSVCLKLICTTLCSVHSKATSVHDFDIFPFTTVQTDSYYSCNKEIQHESQETSCMYEYCHA